MSGEIWDALASATAAAEMAFQAELKAQRVTLVSSTYVDVVMVVDGRIWPDPMISSWRISGIGPLPPEQRPNRDTIAGVLRRAIKLTAKADAIEEHTEEHDGGP